MKDDAAGSLNNRAEQRDDGIRQDRHPDRTRGMFTLPRHCGYLLLTYVQTHASIATSVLVAAVAVDADVESSEARAPLVMTATTTPALASTRSRQRMAGVTPPVRASGPTRKQARLSPRRR